MKIIDPEGKEREVDILGVVTHDNMDAVTGEVAEQIEYVEVNVIGNHREWKNWYPLNKFLEMNPDIDL